MNARTINRLFLIMLVLASPVMVVGIWDGVDYYERSFWDGDVFDDQPECKLHLVEPDRTYYRVSKGQHPNNIYLDEDGPFGDKNETVKYWWVCPDGERIWPDDPDHRPRIAPPLNEST